VMSWNTFTGLEIPQQELQPFDEVPVRFVGDPVQVRGYVELRTTFSNVTHAKNFQIKYIVMPHTTCSWDDHR